jgi:Gluconate 2-dehydrogenase subunit 3
MSENDFRLPRRDVLKFLAAAAILPTSISHVSAAEIASKPYGTDPDLIKEYKPGDLWPLIMTASQRATATALADVLLPADDLGPAASSLRVHDYIDEWISAPYPAQMNDRPKVIDGLAWIENEAQKRYQKGFSAIELTQQEAICKDICWPADAKPEFKKAADFFVKFRSIAMGAYYASTEGWKAIGYVGNLPSITFNGPPAEVLDRLQLVQTVKD